MWFLFGRRVGVKRVPGGNVIRMQCPDCGEVARFYECEEKESYSVFFVPFTQDSARVYRCGACGESFDLVDNEAVDDNVVEPPQVSADERRRQELFAKVAAKRDRERSRSEALSSSETDRQLAELKKKLGR